MNHARLLCGCLAISLGLMQGADRSAAAQPPVWKPLADGTTLAGWHTNGEGEWTIEEGAFVGRSHNAQLYGHLVSDQKYQDFTVRFDFRCPSGDSGFFIRTEMQEPDKTLGLQVQVGPCGSGTGGIYESYGRGWLQQPTLELEQSCYRQEGWNEMVIAAHGPHVTVHVNGVKTADLDDPQISQEAGVFALQMHSGVVNETRFQNLAILQQGTIVPKQFLGTDAPAIHAADDGSMSLHAAAGVGVGQQIRYMPEWGAFGDFTAKDRIEWPLDVKADGPYDVWLAWSVADDVAGQSYRLEVGDQQLTGSIARSGAGNTFQQAKVGQIKLAAGSQRAVFRLAGAAEKSLLKLREVKLIPAP